MFNLNGSNNQLIALWNSWVQSPYEDIGAAILSLKQNYQVACLSNTNDLHWQHLRGYLDLDDLFSPAYASHEINKAKPDKDCFEFVVKDLGVLAGDILFLDDSDANVKAAGEIGMLAYKVDPKFGALPVLKSLGIL